MTAELEGIFDPNNFVPTMSGGQSLPVSPKEGWLVTIVDSTMKPTNKGTGTMLVLCLKIQEGPQTGLEGDWRLNLGNPNPVTVKIAQNELACICHAVGHLGAIQTTEPLHNKPFRVIVVAQMENGQPHPEGYTDIKNVLRADGSKLTEPAGSATPAPAAAPAQATPAAATPPAQAAPAPVTQPQPAPAPVTQPTSAAPPQPVANGTTPPAAAWPAQPAEAPPAQAAPSEAPTAPWNTPQS